MCKIFVLTLLWLPVFFTNPVSQNITALQQHCLWLYILWGLLVLTLLVRRYRPGPWLVCLAAGFVIPWNAAGPGWLNDRTSGSRLPPSSCCLSNSFGLCCMFTTKKPGPGSWSWASVLSSWLPVGMSADWPKWSGLPGSCSWLQPDPI